MKIGKLIGGAAVVLVAVVVVLVFLGLSNIDTIIKTAVESVGPKVTKTDVSLAEVNFQITQGRGELRGLEIGNPAGFTSDYAFSIGKVALEIDPVSVTGNVIVIQEILVDGAKLIAEQKDLTNSNLQTLLNNVTEGSGTSATPSATDSQTDSEAAGDVRLMVEKFRFINSTAQVLTEQWGDKTLTLPNIELNNIGDKEKGLSPDELAQALLKPVIDSAKRGVTKDLEKKLKAEAESKLKEKLSEKDQENLDKLKSLFGK